MIYSKLIAIYLKHDMYAVYHGEFIRNVRRSGYKVVLFPDPTNPSADRFQYCVRGGGLVTFVMFCVL